MKSRIKLLRGLSIGVAMLLVVAVVSFGCAPESPEEVAPPAPPEEEAPPVKDTLVVGVVDLPPTLDCDTSSHPMTYATIETITDTLTQWASMPAPEYEHVFIPDRTTYVGELVESWEMSPDGRTITFHYKKGIKSAYGNESTAEDMLWRYERGFDIHGTTAFFAATMDFYSADAVKVIDDYTLSITTERPVPINILLGCHALMCLKPFDSKEAKKHATADDPWALDWVNTNCPAYGPYYVTEWTPGVQAVFSANHNYYKEGLPAFERIIFKVIPESSSRVAMIRDGTIDVARDLTPREIDSLKDAPGVNCVVLQGQLMAHLIMNQNMVEPFTNKLVRQAVNYAIDRERIIDMAYFGMGWPMKTILAPECLGVLDPEEFPYDYNIEKAKELMEEAGYADGFAVELYYTSGYLHHETACIIIKEDLAKIGIDVTLRKTPLGSLASMVTAREAPFVYYVEQPSLPDPNYQCTLNYLAYELGGFANHGYFDDPVVNDMIMEGKAIIDLEERFEYNRELQRVIIDRAAWGWVVHEPHMWAVRDNLEVILGGGYHIQIGWMKVVD